MPYRPRRRMIDPSLFDSRKIGMLPLAERWLFLAMISRSDDEGRLEVDEHVMRAAAFKFDDVPLDDVHEMIRHVADAGLGTLYQVGDELLFEHRNFADWNPVPPTKFTASKLPASSDEAAELPLRQRSGTAAGKQNKRSEVKRSEVKRSSPRSDPTAQTETGKGELSTSANVDKLTIEFSSSPGKAMSARLKSCGFAYDRKLRVWSGPKATGADALFVEIAEDYETEMSSPDSMKVTT